MLVRNGPSLTRSDLEQITKMYLDAEFLRSERQFATLYAAPEPGVAKLQIYPQYVLDHVRLRRAKQSLADGPSKYWRTRAREWAETVGQPLNGPDDERILARFLQRAEVETITARIRQCEEEIFPFLPGGCPPLFSSNSTETHTEQQPSSVVGKAPEVVSDGRKLSEIVQEFGSDQVNRGEWTEAVLRQNLGTLKNFIAICGDKPLDAYTTGDVANFVRALSRLPRDYDKNEIHRSVYLHGGPLAVLKNMEDKLMVCDTLTSKTVNRHISALSALWPWGMRLGLIDRNMPSIFKDHYLPKPKKGNSDYKRIKDQRPMWEHEHLTILFASTIFLGAASKRLWKIPGPYVFQDERYWGILLGSHLGMRREEIFQLRAEHVQQDAASGIWYIDLETEGLQLKDSGSPRLIPLHNNLIQLGFLDERVIGKAASERLFPETSKFRPASSYGGSFGSWFGRYRRHFGVPDRCDFHSFRHTVVTLLSRAGVAEAHANELVGHESSERRSEFRRYNKGSTLEMLKSDIDRLKLPIDIPALKAALARSAVGE